MPSFIGLYNYTYYIIYLLILNHKNFCNKSHAEHISGRFEILIFFFKLKNVCLYIVEEVDVPEEAPSVHVSGPSTNTFFASTLYGSKRKGKKKTMPTL